MNGALHSLVVRLLWEQNVGGSNPLAPTSFSYADAEGERGFPAPKLRVAKLR